MRNLEPATFSPVPSANLRHCSTFGGAALNIAVVTETFAPEVNGVAMTLGRIVHGLAQRGHQLMVHRPRQAHEDLVAPSAQSQGQPTFQQTLYTGLPIPGYSELRFGAPAKNRFIKQWRAKRPDIVHVVTEGPLGLSAVAAAKALHLPVSSSFHTNFQSYSQHYGVGLLHATIDRYLRHLHNRTLTTMVPTRAMQHELSERGYKNLAVVSRGVEISLFSPSKRSIALRQQWGLRDQDVALLHVGRLAKEKNIQLVVDSYRAIQEQHPRTKLVLVGDGPMRQELQQRYPEVIFSGVQKHEALAQHYASADVFLFPSVTETFGNVVTEALASGLGLVSFARAAALELVQHERNGMLVMQEDPEKFMQMALALVNDKPCLQTIRKAAAPSVAHVHWDAVLDAFIYTLQTAREVHRKRYFPAIGEALAMPLRLSTS